MRAGAGEPEAAVMSHAMVWVPVSRLSLDEFAALAGLHPDLIRRLVALGIVEASYGPGGLPMARTVTTA
jgi:hypothetical protein